MVTTGTTPNCPRLMQGLQSANAADAAGHALRPRVPRFPPGLSASCGSLPGVHDAAVPDLRGAGIVRPEPVDEPGQAAETVRRRVHGAHILAHDDALDAGGGDVLRVE